MKRKLAMIAAAAMLAVMLTACGSSGAQTQDTGSATAATQTDVSAEDTSASKGTLADYEVEIKGAALCKDYEGNPAIAITYSWTNNSEATTSPMGSMMEEAFQDGVQLDMAIVDFEYNDGLTDVRPGTTIDVEAIYKMTSESTVEFELSAIEDAFRDPVPMVTAEFDPTALENRE